jgi:hypothetical protein
VLLGKILYFALGHSRDLTMAIPEKVSLFLLVVAWYLGNTGYNIYNKKALNLIHAHWTVAFAQLVVRTPARVC